MIRSMTGYAEKKYDSSSLSIKISIKTLNHRFFDWTFRGNQMREIENRLRSICQSRVIRGRVEVLIELNFLDQTRWELRINQGLLDNIFSVLEDITSERSKNVVFSVDNLFTIPHVVEMTRKDFTLEEIEFIEQCFIKTLGELIQGRVREGRELKKDIQLYLREIKQSLSQIEKLARRQPGLMREKMIARLNELKHDTPLSDNKLAEEVAYMAQRYDLTEEITRLKCHLEYARELLSPKVEEPAGKKLDFLAQELYREINTINSKSQDVAIIKEGLAIKGWVESIRQQVQNIE